MTFWIIITAIALVVTALLVFALLRGRIGDEAPAAYDLKVYRTQLKEVERDLARGVIGAEDADRTRAEISRRILAADAQLQNGGENGGQPALMTYASGALAAALLIGGGLWLYRDLGAPGYGDQGLEHRIAQAEDTRANRTSQDKAEASLPPNPDNLTPGGEYHELMEKLRAAVAERPEELQGQQLLARNEASLGNFRAAYQAQGKVVELLGDQVQAADLTDYADMMIMAAGGYVSPEAEAALLQALKLDPRNGVARYYMGLMFAQIGRPDATFRAWDQLLQEGPENAPWIPPIRGQIDEIAMLAGVKYDQPAAATAMTGAPGPSSEEMQAAAEMSAEDRQEMIRGMVASLAERLASQGGTAEEWARLISAYGVLGDSERAQVAWEQAQKTFAQTPEKLQQIEAAARQAGLLP